MICTLRLAFDDCPAAEPYAFTPGQFHMVYLHPVGEVALSIVSDPLDHHFFDHTVRPVGRVSGGLVRLHPGDRVGIRGPFGRGWPLDAARGRDLLLLTGGLGCAPVVSVIRYVLRRRADYGRLVILQGVRHADDLIWRAQYEAWGRAPATEVLLAADVAGHDWPWAEGPVVDLLDHVSLDPQAHPRAAVRARADDRGGHRRAARPRPARRRHLAEPGAQHALRHRPLWPLPGRPAIRLHRRAGVPLRRDRRPPRRQGILSGETGRVGRTSE